MKVKYAKAETNVNEIVKVLESHQVQMLKDVALLDKMYELNLTYFKELSMYIPAGKKKLEEARKYPTGRTDGEGRADRTARRCPGLQKILTQCAIALKRNCMTLS